MTQAAALADVALAEAETESAPSFTAQDAGAPATATTPGATEFPIDDDVVLTVTDHVVESEPSPAPTAASALEPEPTPAAASLEPEPALPPTFEELEPLVTPVDPAASHVEDRTEFGFAGRELEPLVVAPAAAAEPQAVAQSAAAEPTPDGPAVVTDQDLDGLTDAASDGSARVAATAPQPEFVRANPREDDPAEFLLEKPTQHVPPPVPAIAQISNAELSNAQLSNALAAIEIELFASARPPDARANPPASPTHATAAKPLPPPVPGGPLAALKAMSEEERIALFS